MSDAPVDEFWELVANIKTCMMTTRDGDALRSRPMVAHVDRDAGELRFLTRLSSHKTEEIDASSQINLAFVDDDQDAFVSVSGTASISRDRALIDDLWGPYADAWFAGGKDDPDVGVIRVDPHNAEYWNITASLVRQAWEMYSARGSDEQPDLGEHKRVAL